MAKLKLKEILKKGLSERITKFTAVVALGIGAIGVAGIGGVLPVIAGLAMLGTGAVLFGHTLDAERRAGRNEGQAAAIAREKMKERIREARKRGDKLAYKSAVLDLASATERETREASVAAAEEIGFPLLASEVMRLRKKEAKKRLKVNKNLMLKEKGPGR